MVGHNKGSAVAEIKTSAAEMKASRAVAAVFLHCAQLVRHKAVLWAVAAAEGSFPDREMSH